MSRVIDIANVDCSGLLEPGDLGRWYGDVGRDSRKPGLLLCCVFREGSSGVWMLTARPLKQGIAVGYEEIAAGLC